MPKVVIGGLQPTCFGPIVAAHYMFDEFAEAEGCTLAACVGVSCFGQVKAVSAGAYGMSLCVDLHLIGCDIVFFNACTLKKCSTASE
jgi:hypothetical protein